MEMAADVLNVLRLLRIDVARQVEIEVVFRDLVMRYEAGVARVRLGIREDINNLVQVALTQAAFAEGLSGDPAGLHHKKSLAWRGGFLSQNKDPTSGAPGRKKHSS